MSGPENGLAIVCRTIADGLALNPEEVHPEDRLIGDLGADSLDFVDLMFRIEKEFGVKILEDELDFLTRLDGSSPDVLREGAFTDGVIERVRVWLPEVDTLPDGAELTPARPFGLITVESIWRMVAARLPS